MSPCTCRDAEWGAVLDLMAAGATQHDASHAVWGDLARIGDHRFAATIHVRRGLAAAFPDLILPPLSLSTIGA